MRVFLGFGLFASFFGLCQGHHVFAQDALAAQQACKQSVKQDYEGRLQPDGQLNETDNKEMEGKLSECERTNPIAAEKPADPKPVAKNDDEVVLIPLLPPVSKADIEALSEWHPLRLAYEYPELRPNLMKLDPNKSDKTNLMNFARNEEGSSKIPTTLELGGIYSSANGFGTYFGADTMSAKNGGRLYLKGNFLSSKGEQYLLPYLKVGAEMDNSKPEAWLKAIAPDAFPVLGLNFRRDKGMGKKAEGEVSVTNAIRYQSHEIKRIQATVSGKYGFSAGAGQSNDDQIIPYLQFLGSGSVEVCYRILKTNPKHYLCGLLTGRANMGFAVLGGGGELGGYYKYMLDEDRDLFRALSIGVLGSLDGQLDMGGANGNATVSFGAKLQ